MSRFVVAVVLALACLVSARFANAEVQNIAEGPDSAPSSPPLDTDDPGTPGPGVFEFNLISSWDSFQAGQSAERGVDLNFGIGDHMQVRYERYFQQATSPDTRNFSGFGPSRIGLKERFVENRSLRVAVYPAFTFDDQEIARDLDGQVLPNDGRSFYLPILAAYQTGFSTLAGNLGYSLNLDDSRANSSFASLAFGHAINDSLRLMMELASTRMEAGHRDIFRFGFTEEVWRNERSQSAVTIFGSLGKTLSKAEDGLDHSLALLGVSFSGTANRDLPDN